MSRYLRVVFAIFAPLAVIAAFIVASYRPGPPERVQSMLSDYLQYQDARLNTVSSVVQIVKASRPGNFTAQMSQTTFGSGVIFHTNLVQPSSNYQSSNPLLFPPVDLWCVQLHQSGVDTPFVAFIAQHENLYNSDWVVHESSAGSHTELNDVLKKVGCDLTLRP